MSRNLDLPEPFVEMQLGEDTIAGARDALERVNRNFQKLRDSWLESSPEGAPALGSFSAYQSTAQSLSAANQTEVNFQTEEWDTSGWFSNNVFTPQIAGIYRLSATWAPSTSWAADEFGRIEIWKNTAAYKFVANAFAATNDIGPHITCLVTANGSTDYFRVLAYASNAKTIRNSATVTYFQGEYVGAA